MENHGHFRTPLGLIIWYTDAKLYKITCVKNIFDQFFQPVCFSKGGGGYVKTCEIISLMVWPIHKLDENI